MACFMLAAQFPRMAKRVIDDAHRIRFGIEEEYFLAHEDTLALVKHAPKTLLKQARAELGSSVTAELLQSQVEIASPVFEDGAQARASIAGLRRGLAEIAARHGLRLVAAGTYPLGTWREQQATPKPRYLKLVDDFQIVARRTVVCGMHVHAEIPPGFDRVQLMNRLLPYLPLFLALSTSSPFWNRQRTGLLSYRQSMYDEWPRTGIPDFFADEAEYARLAALLARHGALSDATSLWWGVRPALKYPTLELRIADVCTRLDDALAIAALYRATIRMLLRDPSHNAVHTALTRRVIDENRWRAKRSGWDESFIREEGEARGFLDVLAELRERCAPDIAALGLAQDIAGLDRIVAEGTSAHRQLAIYAEGRNADLARADALVPVVRWLIDATLAA